MIKIKEIRDYAQIKDVVNERWKVFEVRRSYMNCRFVNEKRFYYTGAKIRKISRNGKTYYEKKRKAERWPL